MSRNRPWRYEYAGDGKMKKKRGILTRALLPALFTAVLITAGCGDENGEDVSTGPEPYAKTEPKYVLANVELAFNRGDEQLLSDCLADGFTFYFDPSDVGEEVNGYVVPASWSRKEFLRATGNMFARTHEISLNNHWKSIGSPEPGETSYLAANVALEIAVMVDRINGYASNDGTCNYEFAKDASRKWHLAKWWDRSRECGCIGPKTFGLILAGYYL
jgi:hypothetical protein